MTSFTLIEGLAALGAFGVMIIANNSLCRFIKGTFISEKDIDILGIAFYLWPLLGISYMTGFLGYVIINSEIIFLRNVDIFIAICLVLTIAVAHFDLFSLINSHFIVDDKVRMHFNGIICAYWGGILLAFMVSPNLTKAIAMIFILLLPLISRHVTSLLNTFKQFKNKISL